MNSLFIPLIFVYCFYIFMILLIKIASTDYCGKNKLFILDLFIPFCRIVRDTFIKIFAKS